MIPIGRSVRSPLARLVVKQWCVGMALAPARSFGELPRGRRPDEGDRDRCRSPGGLRRFRRGPAPPEFRPPRPAPSENFRPSRSQRPPWLPQPRLKRSSCARCATPLRFRDDRQPPGVSRSGLPSNTDARGLGRLSSARTLTVAGVLRRLPRRFTVWRSESSVLRRFRQLWTATLLGSGSRRLNRSPSSSAVPIDRGSGAWRAVSRGRHLRSVRWIEVGQCPASCAM